MDDRPFRSVGSFASVGPCTEPVTPSAAAGSDAVRRVVTAWGPLRLRTTGRKSDVERAALLTYLGTDGAFVVIASNAGATYPPPCRLNLQAQPEAGVAEGAERTELWRRVVEQLPDDERYAACAEREIPVVILEPIEVEADA